MIPSLRLVGTLALALAVACQGGAKPPASKGRPPPLVTVQKVRQLDIAIERRGLADLRPVEQVDVAAKSLGYVETILVDRGDHVTKGQLLALVRPSDLPDQLAAARAAVEQSRSAAALARSNQDRAEQQAGLGLIARQQLEQSQLNRQTAEGSLAVTGAQLAALGVKLGETRLLAPIDGIVSLRHVDPGALVGPPGGGAVLTLVRVDRLRALVSLSEPAALGVVTGLTARLELDALPQLKLEGKVVRVSPVVDPTTRSVTAEVLVDNPEGRLKAGLYAHAYIAVGHHPGALVVPHSAVLMSSKGSSVFAVGPGGRVARRVVKLGESLERGESVEILRGLAAGDEVVVAGAEGLSEGMQVNPQRNIDPYSGKPLSQGQGH